MRNFNDGWLFKPLFDYEYKSYQVLAFEQFLNTKFERWQLYPYVDQVDRILGNLEYFKAQKEGLRKDFPTDIERLDLEKAKLIREGLTESDMMDELNSIMDFAKKHLSRCSSEAHLLQARLSSKIEISPIGVTNNNMLGGYLFFRKPSQTRVYAYEYRMIQRPGRNHRDIRTIYLNAEKTGLVTNFTDFKIKYIKSRKARFGINAYLVEADGDIPHFETALPMVKNHLLSLEAS